MSGIRPKQSMELGLRQAPSLDGMELGLSKRFDVDLGLMKNMGVE